MKCGEVQRNATKCRLSQRACSAIPIGLRISRAGKFDVCFACHLRTFPISCCTQPLLAEQVSSRKSASRAKPSGVAYSRMKLSVLSLSQKSASCTACIFGLRQLSLARHGLRTLFQPQICESSSSSARLFHTGGCLPPATKFKSQATEKTSAFGSALQWPVVLNSCHASGAMYRPDPPSWREWRLCLDVMARANPTSSSFA